jgi:DNA-binding CsgD family transcriptional regulator
MRKLAYGSTGDAMDTVRDRDCRAGLALLHAVAEAGDGAQAFAEAAVRALPSLVASELTSLSACDVRSGHRHVITTPGSAIGAADRAAFDRYFRVHPLVHYHADLRGPGAHRISDSLPFVRFRHTGLYADYYRRIGIDHAVALPLHVDDHWLVSLVLNRRRRDFSDREIALLDLLGPPLARQYRLSAALDAAQRRLHERGLDEARLDACGITAREAEVLGWLAAGKTDREIAVLITCSHRTVHKHLQRIYVKLGVETRTAAVMRALGAGA